MRIKLPTYANKKDLFGFLVANKEHLIAQKKLAPVTSDPVTFGATPISTEKNAAFASKANEPVTESVDTLRVKVVANTANWIDSHGDMLLPGAATKSINERKGLIPFLHDHVHMLEAEIADVLEIYPAQMSLRELGLSMDGFTESIIFVADVKREYNAKVFDKYKAGKIKQHSIGLHYVKIDLAINDEDWGKEKDFWDKHYEQVINKEEADRRGYFWVVGEYKLIENSAVLFGSNILTPTLDNNLKTFEPLAGTQTIEPSNKDTRVMDALNKLLTKF